jgi:hypothetical protein
MKIWNKQQHIGAALLQIVHHKKYRSIVPLKIKGKEIENAYLINGKIPLVCKFCSLPKGDPLEYQFNFNLQNIEFLRMLRKKYGAFYLGLVCVLDGQICALSADKWASILAARFKDAGWQIETQYNVLVTVRDGYSMRAYANRAHRKGARPKKIVVVAKNAFPNALFS